MSSKLKDLDNIVKKMPNGLTILEGNKVFFNCIAMSCKGCPIYNECTDYEGSVLLSDKEVDIFIKNHPEIFI